MRDRMLAGDLYMAADPVLAAESQRAAAVVTRDLPANVVAVGSPARVLRALQPTESHT